MKILDSLYRIHLGNMFDKWPDGLLWADCPIWDIPDTMLGAIRTADPAIKAMTFRNTNEKVDNLLREACYLKDIIVVWTKPPLFKRYLDRDIL